MTNHPSEPRLPTIVQQIRWGLSANALLTKEQWAMIDGFEAA